MGGEGSGRKPDVVKAIFNQIEEQKQAVAKMSGDSLYLPNYSGINKGALKTNVLSNKLAYYNSSGVLTGDSNMTYDGTNIIFNKTTYILTRLNIGRNSFINPYTILEVTGDSTTDGESVFNTIYTDTRPFDTGYVGGGFFSVGKYDSNGTLAGFGGLQIVKANTNDGEYGSEIQFTNRQNGGSVLIRMRITENGVINYPYYPTSSAGLSSGDIWVDSGAGNVLKIVP